MIEKQRKLEEEREAEKMLITQQFQTELDLERKRIEEANNLLEQERKMFMTETQRLQDELKKKEEEADH